MLAYRLAQIAALLCIGLGAGIYLADWMGARRFRLQADPSSAVLYQQVIHVPYQRIMPILVFGAILASAAWLYFVRNKAWSLEFTLVAAALLCAAVIAVLTIAISVPLNKELMTWSVQNPPADFQAKWAPWDRVNGARVLLSTGGFILLLAALIFKQT